MKRKLPLAVACAGLVSLMTLAQAIPAQAASWKLDGSSYVYVNDDGTYYKGWIHTTDNKYYYMDLDTGHMTTGWKQINGKYYYFKSTGEMAVGWELVDGKYYYLNSLDSDYGAMIYNSWIHIGDDYYYVKGDGSMVTGWRPIDNNWYYFREDGRCAFGWR